MSEDNKDYKPITIPQIIALLVLVGMMTYLIFFKR
jgi:hypothetical protein